MLVGQVRPIHRPALLGQPVGKQQKLWVAGEFGDWSGLAVVLIAGLRCCG